MPKNLSRAQRRLLRTLIVLGVVAVGCWLGGQWLARTVRDRSQEIAYQLCGPDSRITIDKVDVDLFAGDVEWTGIRIAQDVDSGDTTWTSDRRVLISGGIDSISVRGVGILRLALGHTLNVRSITVAKPVLTFLMGGDSIAEPQETGKHPRIRAFRLDSLRVTAAKLLAHNVRRGSSLVSVGNVTAQATAVEVDLAHNGAPFTMDMVTGSIALNDVGMALPPLYDARIERVELDHGVRSARISDITLTPRKGPQEYHTLVNDETDLFTLHTGSVQVNGIDLIESINTKVVGLKWVRIAGSRLNAYRDKNMPDAPFKHKSLPAGLLRALPIALRMDSLVVDSLDVHYLEKNDMSPDFGEVTFTRIHGVVTGLNTIPGQDTGHVQLKATGRVFEQAAVTFNFTTSPSDSTDAFTANATVSGLPFHVFNRMTDDLLNVRATAGTIGGMDLTLNGDDRNGSGRLDMEYAGLEVKIQSRDGERREKRFLSNVVNRILRDENLRSSDKFRHGDFTVERRRDRAIFNYLWRSIRAGMMATVLPDVVSTSTKDKKEK